MFRRNRQRTSTRGARGSVAFVLSLCVVALTATGLQAQATGTVTGQILESSSQQAIDGAQVFVSALNQGTLTQQNGRY